MHQPSNKKVVYLRPPKKRIFLAKPVILIGILLAIVFCFFLKLRVKTYSVVKGTISNSFITDGVIIKNETPVLAPASGKVQLIVKSGERVRVGTPLFIITTDEKQKEHCQNEITEIEEKIKVLEDGAVSSQAIPLNLIDKSIEEITTKIKKASESGEFDKVKSLKDELVRLTQEKQNKLDSDESNINLLNKQLKNLKDKLNEIDSVVYAPIAGIVSLNIDGLEELLTTDSLTELTYNQLQGINSKTHNKESSKSIKANQPVMKIIDNFSWYIAIKLEKPMKQGMNYYINFPDTNEKIKAELVSINKEGNVGFFLIKTDLKKLLDSRKIRVEVITGSYTGHIIPTEGLFINEGKEGVYIVERGKKVFKPIEIVTKNENKIIVNGLKPGDKILLK